MEPYLTLIANRIGLLYAKLKRMVRQTDAELSSVQILPYVGHGTRSVIYLKGRVLEKHRVVSGHDADSKWRNLRNTYHRFNSHKMPDVLVTARLGNAEQRVRTDAAGFFHFEITFDPPLTSADVWHDVQLELPVYRGQAGALATASVLIPPEDAQFGVISDLDDTVLRSNVVNLLKLARNTFFYNSHTRLPFAGVAEFYHALQRGTQASFNPIFYVSNSPWNLYDLIVDFFAIKGIPLGPIFLIHLGLSPRHLSRPDPIRNKLEQIEGLLTAHPDLPFLLIGDSGEDDPEVYLQVIQTHPGRIRAVYIRDVTGKGRKSEIRAVVEQARQIGVDMLLVADTVAAAEHAARREFIDAQALPAIRQQSVEDQ